MFGTQIKGLFTSIVNAPQAGIDKLRGLQTDIYDVLGEFGSEAGGSAKNFYAGEAGNKAGIWLANNWQQAGLGLAVIIALILAFKGK